jgi:hypothetical protein
MVLSFGAVSLYRMKRSLWTILIEVSAIALFAERFDEERRHHQTMMLMVKRENWTTYMSQFWRRVGHNGKPYASAVPGILHCMPLLVAI